MATTILNVLVGVFLAAALACVLLTLTHPLLGLAGCVWCSVVAARAGVLLGQGQRRIA